MFSILRCKRKSFFISKDLCAYSLSMFVVYYRRFRTIETKFCNNICCSMKYYFKLGIKLVTKRNFTSLKYFSQIRIFSQFFAILENCPLRTNVKYFRFASLRNLILSDIWSPCSSSWTAAFAFSSAFSGVGGPKILET